MRSRRQNRRHHTRQLIAILGAAILLVGGLDASGADAASWQVSQAADIRAIAVKDRLRVEPDAGSRVGTLGRDGATPGLEESSSAEPVTINAGELFTMVGFTCAPPDEKGAVVVSVRTSLDGHEWSAWYEGDLEVAADEDAPPRAFLEATWTGPGRYVQIAATAAGSRSPDALDDVRLVAIDTEHDDSLAELVAGGARRLAASAARAVLGPVVSAAPAQPAIISRAAWGADESLRNGSPGYAAVRMAFVHHTAGGTSYTRADAPAIVRGIYAYHTTSLGWNDIGYNFLVDRFGTIYEGRYGGVTRGVVGAQVYGFNAGSTGVSVLGTYTSETPSEPALASLEELLAWKLSLSGLDPSGTTTMTCGAAEKHAEGSVVRLPVIAGHRDANYTACPGDAFYALLPSIRLAVAAGTVGDPEPWQVSLELSAAKVAIGAPVTYSGSVRTVDGRAGSGTVTVQKRRTGRGGWIQWRTAELDMDGRFAVTVDMVNRQTWEFRARMLGDGGLNQAGYSAVAGLTVGGAGSAYGPGEYLFTITGRGWGHGIGMSQWGAYGLAKQGRNYRTILRHYYKGVGFAKVKNRTLRVLLRKGVGTVKLTCTDRYTVEGESGTFAIPAGTTASVTRSGTGCRVVAGSFSKTFGSTVTFAPTRARLDVRTETDLGQTGGHRGRIRVSATGSSLAMINIVALESYLRAVVPHEVSPAWPSAALRAQACAARAYAEAARRSSTRQWDLYCDVRSQAYGGVEWENARTSAAVWATTGVVPVYGGRPIQAFYFSSSGGRTENIEHAWQTSAVPYLKSVKDPYDAVAPLHTWGPLRRTPAQLERALAGGVKGSLRAIYRVEAGVSPRVVKAAIIGSDGTTYLHGSTLRTRLGLNSAWATVRSLSIRPSAAEEVVAAPGENITLSGCVYPALASGARVTLRYRSDGTWRSRGVSTRQHALKLSGRYTARYSTYSVTVRPTQTTEYYFEKGVARSPRTTISVR